MTTDRSASWATFAAAGSRHLDRANGAALLGERAADQWPPRYRRWSAGR